ncbi:MAG: DUF2267 domain-containing protein [Henriciella sp.]|nr:DUF2267 domain-containing protein [Henriciella sp.]
MSTTGLSQFDDTIHTTNVWLKEIMQACDWTDRRDAYRALRVTLHTLRDHLPVEIVAHLSAQLPLLIRGALFEGWKPSVSEIPERDLVSFLDPIQMAFDRKSGVDPEKVAKAVFDVLRKHVSEGEMNHVAQALPRHVRKLLVD